MVFVRRFKPVDQAQAKRLIIGGLAEHWGEVDKSLNEDLNCIGDTYGGRNVFVVAEECNRIVGTGGLIVGATTAEVVRMSVAHDFRRCGIGSQILNRLCEEAEKIDIERLFLETTASWSEVIEFYLNFGFEFTHEADGPFGREAHFSMSLEGRNRRIAPPR